MVDARRLPPSGPPPRDPTAPARLLDAAAEVGLRVERAHRNVEGLAAAVDRLATAAGLTPGPRDPGLRGDPAGTDPERATATAAPRGPGTLGGARALAIDLAVGGSSHDVIREQLRLRFGIADPGTLIAEPASGAAEPQPYGEPHGEEATESS